MRSLTMLGALCFALLLGTLVALAARAGTRHDPAGEEIVDIPLDRVKNTITLPPDHNARVTTPVDPVLHIRRRNEQEARRRIDFFRPRIADALQAILARYHYSSLQRAEAQETLAGEARTAINGILGGEFVEGVTIVRGGPQ